MESLNALIQGMGLMHLGMARHHAAEPAAWLAIAKKFEPLLLPIGFGGLLSIPEAGLALPPWRACWPTTTPGSWR
jgi:oxaloacetate decarboxylase beta subunit